MASIVITGGSGTLGRMVVPLLLEQDHTVTVASRQAGSDDGPVSTVVIDLGASTDQAALIAALRGADVVIHLAGSAKGDDVKTANLLTAIRTAGTRPHLLAMSVVGADRTPVVSAVDRALFGYVAAKRASEQLIERSGLPWTVLRATQFHEFVVRLAQTVAKLPVIMVPGHTPIQPVDGHEVARRVVDLALGGPAGTLEIGGPTVYQMTTIIRGHLRSQQNGRPVLGVRMPGRAAAAFRAGANLTLDGEQGHRTWEDFTAGVPTAAR